MSRLMENCTYSLIGYILRYTHPSAIAAVGSTTTRTCTRNIVSTKMESLNTSPLIKIIYCLLNSCTTTLVCCLIRTSLIPGPSTGTLRMGNNFHLITICNLICFIHNVRAHIVNGCRRQALCHKDKSIECPSLCRAIIKDGRIVLFAPTYTTLKNITTSKGSTQHGFCRTTYEIRICICHLRSRTCTFRCIRNIKSQFCLVKFHYFSRKFLRSSFIILA